MVISGGMILDLLEPYDREASVQAVRDFFCKDDPDHPRNYWRIKRRYEAMYSLGGHSEDVTGIHGSGGNHTEDKLIAGNPYMRAMNSIKRGLQACSIQSRLLLIDRYIEGKKVWAIQLELKLTGNDRYQKADQRACYEFADAMDYIVVEDDVQDLIPQLLIKKGTK